MENIEEEICAFGQNAVDNINRLIRLVERPGSFSLSPLSLTTESQSTQGQQPTRKQREEVLRKARKEKPTGIYIMEDLASATLKKREPQVPKLLAAKEAGKIAYFILDRLVIRDKPAEKSAPAVDS